MLTLSPMRVRASASLAVRLIVLLLLGCRFDSSRSGPLAREGHLDGTVAPDAAVLAHARRRPVEVTGRDPRLGRADAHAEESGELREAQDRRERATAGVIAEGRSDLLARD